MMANHVIRATEAGRLILSWPCLFQTSSPLLSDKAQGMRTRPRGGFIATGYASDLEGRGTEKAGVEISVGEAQIVWERRLDGIGNRMQLIPRRPQMVISCARATSSFARRVRLPHPDPLSPPPPRTFLFWNLLYPFLFPPPRTHALSPALCSSPLRPSPLGLWSKLRRLQFLS